MENHTADRPLPPEMTVLSRFQAGPLLDARRRISRDGLVSRDGL